MSRHLLFIPFFLLSYLAFAQNPTAVAPKTSKKDTIAKKRHFELGLSANAYKGDLYHAYRVYNAGLHLGIRPAKLKRINGHLNLMAGTVSGQNAEFDYPDSLAPAGKPVSFFKTTIFALNYDLQLNLIKKKNLRLYLSQGIGLIRFNPKDAEGKSLPGNMGTRSKNEAYNVLAFMFPTQAGIMYHLPNEIGVGFQAGWLNQATDYVDNLSKLSSYNKKDNLLIYKFFVSVPFQMHHKKSDITE